MAAPILKQGDLLSRAYLEWIRSRQCSFCDAAPPSHAHHWPPKGRLGYTNDLETLPVCAAHHGACHGQSVVFNGLLYEPVEDSRQTGAVEFWQSVFLEMASVEQWRQVGEDRAKWIEARIW